MSAITRGSLLPCVVPRDELAPPHTSRGRRARAVAGPIVGTSWADVGEPLCTLQHPAKRVRGAGVATVRWGRSRLARWLAHLLRLPAPGRHVDAALSVEPGREAARWRRSFGDVELCTTQEVCERKLTEHFGPIELTFQLVTGQSSVTFAQRAAALRLCSLRIPLPACIAPTVRGQAFNLQRGRVHASVEVQLPLLGRLLAYTTTMHIEEVQA